MRFKKVKYEELKKWFENCNILIEKYKFDNSLTMEIEWALLQNYKKLCQFITEYNQQVKNLVDKYGTLRPDGRKELDITSNVTMELYNKELKELSKKQKTVGIETVNHKHFCGFQGATLETMSLLDFMIE